MRSDKTIVSLVGAGPGDPELLTIKAQNCLKKADAVFFDALVNPIILSYCPKGCELVPVGKRAGCHSHSQESINDLLILRAKKGGRIVRLKGGDPFVFGRGGEELLALIREEIPFEVIPGITAGMAVPTYAGVPVTHRGVSRSVTFVTAATKTERCNEMPWRSLATLGGTLIFYMGCSAITTISSRLLENGMHLDTPAMIVAEGTLPSQKRLVATLETFSKEGCINSKEWTPGLFVVGEVISFATEFAPSSVFQTPAPKILCVTMHEEARDLKSLLGDKVAYFHTMEMVERKAVHHIDTPLLEMLLEGGSPLLFLSPFSVECTLSLLLEKGLDLRDLQGKLFTTGRRTTKALRQHGLQTAGSFTLNAPFSSEEKGLNEIVILGDETDYSRQWVRYFEQKGISANTLKLYEEFPPVYTKDEVIFLQSIGFTHILFSSSSSIKHFDRLMAQHPSLSLILERAQRITYGATSNDALKRLGYDSITPPKGKRWTPKEVAELILGKI